MGDTRGTNTLHWRYEAPPPEARDAIAASLGVSPVVAGLLIRAGYTDADSAKAFLSPRLAHLQNPFAIANLEAATNRILQAMEKKERIGIVGDYDVDGVTSTVLLVGFLRKFGCFPDYLVPLRMEEGYGLSKAALERLMGENPPELLIALDCGTNSVEEVAAVRAQGVEVIIVDHHQSKEAVPQDCILVNPHVHDDSKAPWLHLCSVGLTFKLCHGLAKKLREMGDATASTMKLKDSLDLVALGSIADLVPLRDENRILTRFGLRRLQETPRPGIRALMDLAGLQPEQQLSTPDVSFRLGPRINAGGRMADAALPVELFLSDDYAECLKMARELDSHNRDRQDTERLIFQDALAQAQAQPEDIAGIVVFGQDWHPGVLGIVAGRLAREFHRPTIVLGSEGEAAKGSGRSIKGLCLQKILTRCDDLLGEWGGHSMAVGLSMELEGVDRFRAAFAEAVAEVLGDEPLPERDVEIAAWLEESDLGESLLGQLEALHPFGQGNSEPVFGLRGVRLAYEPDTFGRGHLRFPLRGENGQRVQAIYWNGSTNRPPAQEAIDLAVKLSWNYWQGRKSPRAELVAWRPSEG